MQDDEAYRLEDQIGFKLRVAHQRHLEIFSEEMPAVTPRQFAVLAKLSTVGAVSQNQLGRLVAMDAATTKGVVERLLRKGFIAATPSPADRRRVEISLTSDGRSFVETAIPVARHITERTARNLSAREYERLLALLDRL